MTIKLYMDEQVPRQITLGLRLRNIDVLTVQEDDRTGLDDPNVLARAAELQRVTCPTSSIMSNIYPCE
jgi:Domain of unknown function (DUF5615)